MLGHFQIFVSALVFGAVFGIYDILPTVFAVPLLCDKQI